MELANNVPVPNITRRGQKRKYPFNEMRVGDSVSFDSDEVFIKARRAARGHMKKHGGIFTSRKGYQVVDVTLEEGVEVQEAQYVGKGGTIWRVE